MGSCLGKTADCPDVVVGGAGEAGNNQRPTTTAVTESGGHLQKAKQEGNSLEEVVNQLIRETLCVIGSIVENDSEPPYPMVRLHDITERPSGWIQLVHSLIEVVPLSHPMAPSVITMLLDDSPLPTKECVERVARMVSSFKHDYKKVHRERNFCIILGCLAEKLSGPNSNALLADDTLVWYLIRNLESCSSKDVTLFSIIALEKFAKTNENKEYIKTKLKSMTKNPLLELEKYADSSQDLAHRQIGFCARWCLDNYFCIEGRKYSYETVETGHINAMLNVRDVSEYLKISADGLESRCDEYTFESVRCTCQVDEGRWYYEALIITPGVMQIGWATKRSRFLSQEGYGIGDDIYSISFDGCRRLIWHNAKSVPHNLSAWQSGSILGCLLDLDRQEIVFSLNGETTERSHLIFENVTTGFFAAASFMSFQQCRFNFGTEPFKYPPTDGPPFQTFNASGTVQDKTILPRHLYLDQLRKLSIKENSCTICFDTVASVRIEPCKHSGYCDLCVKQLIDCPMCRGPILLTVPDDTS